MQRISSLCRTHSMCPHGRCVEWLQSLRCSQKSQGKAETHHNVRTTNIMSEATLPTADLGPQIILTLANTANTGLLLCWRKGEREEGRKGEGKEKGRHVLLGTEEHFQLNAISAEKSGWVGEPWISDTIVFMHWGVGASENKVQKCIWLTWLPSFIHSGRLWPHLLSHTRTVKALFYPRGKVFLRTWIREFVRDQT